jgi:hypothetical protein
MFSLWLHHHHAILPPYWMMRSIMVGQENLDISPGPRKDTQMNTI